ncbi:hypothetical protein [Streptomyces sp. AC602_WCS936]|uniref:hypothetical protein n=1 Tax=Streptomyces sp. AC602_WCS936 TaxID=2823685 RepID=UPI001C2806ED|nr:hypothetical protein [Streptomyces sp. AC602_WCS936]
MGFTSLVERALEASHSALRELKRAGAAARRMLTRIDIWVQDHHVALLVGVMSVVLPCVSLVVWTHWDTVVEVAKQLAPVVTVIGFTAGAVASTVKWVRKRRAARLAAATETAGLPAGQGAGSAQTGGGIAASSPLGAQGGAHDAA